MYVTQITDRLSIHQHGIGLDSEVTIEIAENPGTPQERRIQERIPGAALVELVAKHVRAKKIGRLEDASDEDILGLPKKPWPAEPIKPEAPEPSKPGRCDARYSPGPGVNARCLLESGHETTHYAVADDGRPGQREIVWDRGSPPQPPPPPSFPEPVARCRASSPRQCVMPEGHASRHLDDLGRGWRNGEHVLNADPGKAHPDAVYTGPYPPPPPGVPAPKRPAARARHCPGGVCEWKTPNKAGQK